MGAIVAVAAHELRARWRAWVSLALLVAFAGGCVLATVAGARRTGSAYQRFLLASKASDVLVSPAGTGLDGYYQALARLPGIAAVAPIVGLSFLPVGPGGQPVSASVAAAPLDRRWGHLLDIPKVIDGRLPLAGRPDEVAVDQIGARALGVHVGSTLVMKAAPADPSPGAAAAAARRPPLRQRVVGIIVTRGSVHPVNNLDKLPGIFVGPALLHQLGRASQAFDGAYVKLRAGYSPAIAGHQAEALAQRFRATGGRVFVADEGTQAAAIQRSIRPEAISLALFALVLTITALLVVGQAATRLLAAARPATPVLAALGMTRGQLMAAGLLQVGAAAAAGAAAAVGLAIAASPLMPIGTARLAEPDPGVSVDAAVLTAGAVVIVVLAVARVARTARRLASGGYGGPAAPASAGRSKVAGWLAGAGAGKPGTPRSICSSAASRRSGRKDSGWCPRRHRLDLWQSRDDRDRRFGRSGDRGGRGPWAVAVADLACGPPAAYRQRDRARHVHAPADRPDRRADGHDNHRRPPAGGPHRGPRGLSGLRPGQLHADRSRRGCRDHHSGAEDAGRAPG
jgi:hypothetical protein